MFTKLYFLIIQLDNNPCLNSPCLNGATCQVTGSGFNCVCPLNYSGTYCQTSKF